MKKYINVSDKKNYLFKALERIPYREKYIKKHKTLLYKSPFNKSDIELYDCYSLLFLYLNNFRETDIDLDVYDRYSYVGDIIHDSEHLIEDDIIIEKYTDEYKIYKVLCNSSGELYLNQIFNCSGINSFIDYCIFLNQTEYRDAKY